MPGAFFRAGGWTVTIAILVVACLAVGGFAGRTLLLLAMALILTLPMALRAIKGRLDLLEPLVLGNIALGVMFLGRPLSDLATGTTAHAGYSIVSTFDAALVVSLVGVAAFQFGYLSPLGTLGARLLPRPPAFRPARAVLAAWLFVLLGSALFAVFLAKEGGLGLLVRLLGGRDQADHSLFFGTTGYLYNGIFTYGAGALIFFAAATAGGRRAQFLPFTLVLLPLLVFFGARGIRITLFPVLMAIPVFWYLWRGRRPRLRTWVIVLLIGASLVGWQRQIRNSDSEKRQAAAAALGEALASPLTQMAGILSGHDAEMFDSLANELRVVPERLAFQHGALVRDVLIRAVPRPLWPDKPLESNDALVEALWPDHFSVARGAPAFSIVGAFYLDSGLATVALGMFLVGAAAAALWRWMLRQGDSVIAKLVYSMGLPFLVILMRGTIPDTLSRMLFMFLPIVLLIVLVRVRGLVGMAFAKGAAG